ncbi:MAG: hypothetical protein H6Q68_2325 [Firmicutes bacterium]|nr:hypothetical protein [Bacillota bacterium]
MNKIIGDNNTILLNNLLNQGDEIMNIGFLTKWSSSLKWSDSIKQFTGNIVGEELYAGSLCRELMQIKGVNSAQVYTPDFHPAVKLDVMIHFNDTLPIPTVRKNILYIQNFYVEGSDVVLRKLQQTGYDGYIFFSQRLLEIHQQAGFTGIFLPLAADTNIFKPQAPNPKYEYDVVYVGNDIKGEERTIRYIYPAMQYNFGLFGNWQPTWHHFSHNDILGKISQGSITREEAAAVYSSAKIILNFTAQDSIYWDALNLRFFEAMACKGFLISDKVPSAERELKDCVVFTDGYDDSIKKIDYYLSRPRERNEFAENGYQYVLQHATAQARAHQLYDYIQEILS